MTARRANGPGCCFLESTLLILALLSTASYVLLSSLRKTSSYVKNLVGCWALCVSGYSRLRFNRNVWTKNLDKECGNDRELRDIPAPEFQSDKFAQRGIW